MRVKLARHAGFCMGVRRAMEIVLAEANRNKLPIYTYGPIIHNNEVLKLLESRGVKVINDIEEVKEGTLVIRAHGISPQKRAQLKATNLKIVDATCPRVAKVQSIIKYHTRKGYTPIIAGEENHPEVIGLVGYSDNKAYVIRSPSDVKELPHLDKVILAAQTTQDWALYQEIKSAVKERFPEALIFDTICDATVSRQKELEELSKEVDGFVVVGGYHSGNTKRLVQVAGKSGLPVFHVDTPDKLDRSALSSLNVVGVTAGASTPNWLIKEVVREIEGIKSIREKRFFIFIKNLLKYLFLSNILVAIGAFSLSYGLTPVHGMIWDWKNPLLSFFYIYAMHVINRYLDRASTTYNEPEMIKFYKNHSLFLAITSLGAIIGSYYLAYSMGKGVFLLIAILTLIGILYSISIVPKRFLSWLRYRKIKDIPGSKTFSIAFAWSIVIGVIPWLRQNALIGLFPLISFIFVFALIYIRSAIFDIFHMQGDLIVGSETLPIIIGEKRALSVLKILSIGTTLFLILIACLYPEGGFFGILSLCPLSLLICITVYEKRWLRPGIRFEAMIEGSVILSGLLALIWNLSK